MNFKIKILDFYLNFKFKLHNKKNVKFKLFAKNTRVLTSWNLMYMCHMHTLQLCGLIYVYL